LLLALFAAILVAACAATRPAPVVERGATAKKPPSGVPTVTAKPAAPIAPAQRPEFYTVRPGDTLYTIAAEHSLDHRDLALWNGIDNPSTLKVGQQLRIVAPGVIAAPLRSADGAVDAKPLDAASPASPLPVPAAAASAAIISEPKGVRLPYSDQALAQLSRNVSPPQSVDPKPVVEQPPTVASNAPASAKGWIWPATGKLLATFDATSNKGIDIAGKVGQPIVASAPGRVIFSGAMRGLGKVVVLEHADELLSVYAHNNELLVKQGQSVARGQKIAEMGNSDATQAKLHFQIRRRGNPTPLDPLKVLPDHAG
jgi:lipoprotein NlpD